MAVNLAELYAKEIQTKFTKESLIAGLLSNAYSFSGVKTVNITTPITVPMTDYKRTGSDRYGTPVEMQDVIQEMTLTQDKSFSLTIDKGNNADQNGVKAAGKMLSLQIAEQAVPTMDKYCFSALAQKGGKVVGNTTPLSKSNICTRISLGTTYMDDAEIPAENRALLVTSAAYAMLRFSDEFQKVENLFDKSLSKGQVGTYDGMKVIKVPKGRWPANVNFMIVHKSAGCAPVKLNDTKLHQDPPGISGNLLEGRQYYDLFVFGAKSDGVYVEIDASSGKGTVCAAPTISKTALSSSTSGATVKYTTDGSDPRYSKTAKIGAVPDVTATGTVIRAYAYMAGAYPSEVSETTL